MYTTIAAASIAALACVSSVEGHMFMSNPLPRARTIPGHRFQYEPQSDGIWMGECQDGGKIGPIQAVYTQGDIITVTSQMNAPHNGVYQLRFCADPYGRNACLSQTLAIPITRPSNGRLGLVNSMEAVHVAGSHNEQWQLPADLTCEHCVMQFWYQNDNGNQEHFKSCHDVRINPRDGSAPPVAPIPPPTNPEDSNPVTPPVTPPSGSTDGCKCVSISTRADDAWCAQGTGTSMCVPDYAEYCVLKCDGAVPPTIPDEVVPIPPPTNNAPVTVTTTTTVTATVTVPGACDNSGPCTPLWAQCGGKGLPTTKCCTGHCNTSNEWYFQCVN